MRIGELAGRCGVSAKTLRFYEAEGLLPDPGRTPSGYRDYDPAAADRVAFVRAAQAAGFTLRQVREVLAIHDEGLAPCRHVADLVTERLAEVDRRMAELERTRARLQQLDERTRRLDPADCNGYCTILDDERARPA